MSRAEEFERRKAAHDIGVADLAAAYEKRGLSTEDARRRARKEQDEYSRRAEQQANDAKK